MTDYIGVVYAKNYTKLSRPVRPGVIYIKKSHNNDVINLTSAAYTLKRKLNYHN